MRRAAIIGIFVALAVTSARGSAAPTNHLDVTPAAFPDGTVGTPYNVSIKIVGGLPDARFQTCIGTNAESDIDKLPKGVGQKQVSPTELQVSGTPTEAGKFIMDVCATDAKAEGFRKIYEFTIAGKAVEKKGADVGVSLAPPEDVAGYTRLTASVTNAGPDTAENVVVTESTSDVDSVTSTQGRCNEPAGGGFTCQLGAMKKGAKVQIRVVLKKSTSRYRIFRLKVDTKTDDPVTKNDSVLLELRDESLADVLVLMSGPKSTLTDEIEWRLKIKNLGPDEARVELVDDRPAGATFDKFFVDSPNTECELRVHSLRCSTGWISKSDKGLFVTIHGRLIRGNEVTNTARVSVLAGTRGTRDPALANNHDSVTTTR
jgi:hypothetical protein